MRGIKESVILWRHVLPNAMLPIVTLLGLSLGSLLGGTAVVEIIYNWPGMGSMAIKQSPVVIIQWCRHMYL